MNKIMIIYRNSLAYSIRKSVLKPTDLRHHKCLTVTHAIYLID